MTNVIEFPSSRVKPDCLPQPGDRYQAYGIWEKIKPSAMVLVFPDWSMTWFSYDKLGHGGFSILNDECDRDGDGEIQVAFGGIDRFYDIIITGHNIFGLFQRLSNRDVRWVWELPKSRAAVKDGQPVVHSVEIRKTMISCF